MNIPRKTRRYTSPGKTIYPRDDIIIIIIINISAPTRDAMSFRRGITSRFPRYSSFVSQTKCD